MINCPICDDNLGEYPQDYYVIASILQAHVRHNHIGAYDSLFTDIERRYKVKTDRYREIRQEADRKTREVLIDALQRRKPIYGLEIVNILINK